MLVIESRASWASSKNLNPSGNAKGAASYTVSVTDVRAHIALPSREALLRATIDGDTTSMKYEHVSGHAHTGGGGFSQQHAGLPPINPLAVMSGPPSFQVIDVM
jgi:hypothetical protein